MTYQPEFDFSTGPADDAAPEITAIVQNFDQFSPGFDGWLVDNWHVWREFSRQADAIWQRGFKHYSARTIGEFLRHHTALSENGAAWKLNNNTFPDLARLYGLMRSDRVGFFEFRVMPGSRRAA